MRSESRAAARSGFTLFEVLAAVLILGLFYTVLAEAAIRGLRSEGMDRRRAEASLIADRHLVDLQTALDAGAPLEPVLEEQEIEEFRVTVEVRPEDVLALLPQPLEAEVPEETEDLPRLLVDERGDSRIYRLRVAVNWEEGDQPQEVLRETWQLDTSELAGLFPVAGDGEDGEGADGGLGGTDEDAEAAEGGATSPASSRASGSRGRSRSPTGPGGTGSGRGQGLTLQDMMRILQEKQP